MLLRAVEGEGVLLLLIALLVAFMVGYLIRRIPVSKPVWNRCFNYSVIVILALMGYGFGVHSHDLLQELWHVAKTAFIFMFVLLVFNFVSVSLLFARSKHRVNVYERLAKGGFVYVRQIFSGIKYILVVAVGILLSLWIQHPVPDDVWIIDVILMFILFIVGHQLRVQGLSLSEALLNRAGLILGGIIVISSWVAGLLVAELLGLPLKFGILYTSGFGWYSLSGVVVSHMVTHQAGATIFFIDFFHELMALFLIPIVGVWQTEATVGYCGVSALDFTLPILRQYLGDKVLPIAISSGMILTIITPILLPLLSHWCVV